MAQYSDLMELIDRLALTAMDGERVKDGEIVNDDDAFLGNDEAFDLLCSFVNEARDLAKDRTPPTVVATNDCGGNPTGGVKSDPAIRVVVRDYCIGDNDSPGLPEDADGCRFDTNESFEVNLEEAVAQYDATQALVTDLAA